MFFLLLFFNAISFLGKYPLLLRELIKYTPNTHADHPKLEDAFNKINSVVLEVNESQRANESRKKIIELQNRLEGVELFGQLVSPSRIFLKEGNLIEINSETETAFYFLFNDLLVRAVPRNRSKLASLLKQKKEDMLAISAWITNLPKLEINVLNDTRKCLLWSLIGIPFDFFVCSLLQEHH